MTTHLKPLLFIGLNISIKLRYKIVVTSILYKNKLQNSDSSFLKDIQYNIIKEYNKKSFQSLSKKDFTTWLLVLIYKISLLILLIFMPIYCKTTALKHFFTISSEIYKCCHEPIICRLHCLCLAFRHLRIWSCDLRSSLNSTETGHSQFIYSKFKFKDTKCKIA